MVASIGIVGAIASGKSTATRWFAARGWTVVDADTEAHALYEPGSELVAALELRFGRGILHPTGALDRAALGKIVFADPVALADLEALVHPLARQRIWSAVDQAAIRGESVVLEMALLYRWPRMIGRLDQILGIRCADWIRLERLVERSGMAPDQARHRLLAQDEAAILSVATSTVSNEGDPTVLTNWLETLTL